MVLSHNLGVCSLTGKRYTLLFIMKALHEYCIFMTASHLSFTAMAVLRFLPQFPSYFSSILSFLPCSLFCGSVVSSPPAGIYLCLEFFLILSFLTCSLFCGSVASSPPAGIHLCLHLFLPIGEWGADTINNKGSCGASKKCYTRHQVSGVYADLYTRMSDICQVDICFNVPST